MKKCEICGVKNDSVNSCKFKRIQEWISMCDYCETTNLYLVPDYIPDEQIKTFYIKAKRKMNEENTTNSR